VDRYGSIYIVTNTVTGEQYVGQTRQKAVNRWKSHIRTANSKTAIKYKLAQAIITHGKTAFEFAEVFSAFDSSALNSAEINFIADLAPAYNIAKGGAGHRGIIPSTELCRARSERLKKRWEDPVWRANQLRNLQRLAKSPEAALRGKRLAALGLGTATRWANHIKKEKPSPPIRIIKVKQDPLIGRMLSARAKWKPVYCPELQCSFLSQKMAAAHFRVVPATITQAIKKKGKVNRMFTLEKVA
jgi:group I intron endonuclease